MNMDTLVKELQLLTMAKKALQLLVASTAFAAALLSPQTTRHSKSGLSFQFCDRSLLISEGTDSGRTATSKRSVEASVDRRREDSSLTLVGGGLGDTLGKLGGALGGAFGGPRLEDALAGLSEAERYGAVLSSQLSRARGGRVKVLEEVRQGYSCFE